MSFERMRYTVKGHTKSILAAAATVPSVFSRSQRKLRPTRSKTFIKSNRKELISNKRGNR